MRLAVCLYRRAGERAEKLREAHHGMERDAFVVARRKAIAVDDHVRAGVDPGGPTALSETSEMRPVARGEAARARRMDVTLAVPRPAVARGISGPEGGGELPIDRQNRRRGRALPAVRGRRARVRSPTQ